MAVPTQQQAKFIIKWETCLLQDEKWQEFANISRINITTVNGKVIKITQRVHEQKISTKYGKTMHKTYLYEDETCWSSAKGIEKTQSALLWGKSSYVPAIDSPDKICNTYGLGRSNDTHLVLNNSRLHSKRRKFKGILTLKCLADHTTFEIEFWDFKFAEFYWLDNGLSWTPKSYTWPAYMIKIG